MKTVLIPTVSQAKPWAGGLSKLLLTSKHHRHPTENQLGVFSSKNIFSGLAADAGDVQSTARGPFTRNRNKSSTRERHGELGLADWKQQKCFLIKALENQNPQWPNSEIIFSTRSQMVFV